MIDHEADEVIEEFFKSLKNRYQNSLESIKSSEFVFDQVHLLYYKCNKTILNRGESYTDSLDWIRKRQQ